MQKRSIGAVAGGTTDDIIAAVTSRSPTPSTSQRTRSSAPYSSPVRSTRVSARKSVLSVSPWNKPNTVCVLPMSTARSMSPRLYRGPGGLAAALIQVVIALACFGCKKKPIAEDPEEQGKLSRIAARLEEGLGDKAMPSLKEPDKLIDRLARWDDFRSCTVRAFASRKRAADDARREGVKRTIRQASIGEAAVEECAVQAAIVNKD